jgi:hypothetical protein
MHQGKLDRGTRKGMAAKVGISPATSEEKMDELDTP